MTQRRAEFFLITIAMAWGTSWLFMKMGVDTLTPFNIIFLRFTIAFVIVALVFHRRLKGIDKETAKAAAVSGLIMVGMTATTLVGLETTMASTGGFIMSINAVFVVVIQAVLLRRLPTASIVVAVVLSMAGVFFLTGAKLLDFDAGTWWILLATLLNSVYIIYVGPASKRVDALQLGILQLGFAGAMGFVLSVCTETLAIPDTPNGMIAIVGLSLIGSAYCFVMQPVAQKHTTSERVGIIWSTESLWAAVFAFIFLGERFTPLNYLGAVLTFAAVLIALTDWDKLRKPSKNSP